MVYLVDGCGAGGAGDGIAGGWNFSLPMGIYNFEPRHDTFGGNFFWGVLTAILATPCTAPLLPPVLAWAVLQPKVLGVAVMLTVGVGMALPYLILERVSGDRPAVSAHGALDGTVQADDGISAAGIGGVFRRGAAHS